MNIRKKYLIVSVGIIFAVVMSISIYFIHLNTKLNEKYDNQAYVRWVSIVGDTIDESVKYHFEDLNTESIDKNTIKAIGNIIGEEESIKQIPLEFEKIGNGNVQVIENEDYNSFKKKINIFVKKEQKETITKKVQDDYIQINRKVLNNETIAIPDVKINETDKDSDYDSAYIVTSSMIIPDYGLGDPKYVPIKMKIQYKDDEYSFQYLEND